MPTRRIPYLVAAAIIVAVGVGIAVLAARRPEVGSDAGFRLPLLLDLSHSAFRASPPGYIAVLPTEVYTPQRGFGWSRLVHEFDANTWPADRLDLDALHRDAHLGLNAYEQPGPVFRIDVPPGRYRLKLITGSAVHGQHALGLRVNGRDALPLSRLAGDGEPRTFELDVTPEDGRIELGPFTAFPTEWLISALELRRLRDS